MIKLIASDIDGTLLTEGTNQIHPDMFTVIKDLKEKGILFAAASGRHYSSMYQLFEPVKDDIIFIAENGAYVSCRGRSMVEDVLDWELVKKWVKQARKIPGVSFTLEAKDLFYTESQDPVFLELLQQGYQNNLEVQKDTLQEPKEVMQVALYHPHIREIADPWIAEWSDCLHCVISGEIWMDFTNPGVNKGVALREIQRLLQISPEETMVFGDNYNDLEMFSVAEESYAVGNAAEAVRNAAKHVTDTAENHGVLKVMKTLG